MLTTGDCLLALANTEPDSSEKRSSVVPGNPSVLDTSDVLESIRFEMILPIANFALAKELAALISTIVFVFLAETIYGRLSPHPINLSIG